LQRDLRELEERGQIIRVHGGVMHPQYLSGESTLVRRGGQKAEAKRRIGAAAVAHIPSNATVLIDAGTTCLEAARLLLLRGDIRIFTHSVPVLAAAIDMDAAARVVSLGGQLRNVSGALVGGEAQQGLKRLRCDYALIAASGLHAEDGLSTTELHEAGVKNLMIERAKNRILLADRSKCDQPAAYAFSTWAAVDRWIVDENPPGPYRKSVSKFEVASS
jgi:DeoR/GlpR family transcriptional regulator of sugar metabolism